MQQLLGNYLEIYGYWVLLLWTFLEGEAGLILAGFLASQGHLNIFGVMATALCGAFFGDQFYFYLGRWKGKQLLGLFTLIARKFRKALRLIEKYGSLVAFVSRYTYGFRIVLPIILGMSSFPASRFLWLNLCSASLWALLFSSVGFLFGTSASLVVEDIDQYEFQLLIVLTIAIFCFWLSHFFIAWWRRRHARRRLKRMKGFEREGEP
ncbi:membrane protein [Geotalea uraniireducens]|uniref:Membrane protein n=1 Tax=Geotalea uraniireducens TaxID=351604 RepID=A0ABN6VRW8_9BACT|nr:DedA family protein [Geotalea uraniireducens]BDV43113.1 membrane protein [Geotalea uraniireducens]